MAHHLRCVPAERRAETDAGEPWATQLLAAEKDERKIAVAVNSFIGRSDLATLTQAFAQLALSRPRVHAVEVGQSVVPGGASGDL